MLRRFFYLVCALVYHIKIVLVLIVCILISQIFIVLPFPIGRKQTKVLRKRVSMDYQKVSHRLSYVKDTSKCIVLVKTQDERNILV